MVCTPARRRQSNSALLGKLKAQWIRLIALFLIIYFTIFTIFRKCCLYIWRGTVVDLIMEGGDMFWGLVVKPGKRYESKVIEFLT